MILRIVRSAVALSLTLATCFPANAQEVTLKVHHIFSAQSIPNVQVMQPWCDKVAAESNQRIKCQMFPSMQLGGTPPQLIDQVRDGVVDVIFTMVGYTAGRFPVMEVFELPFMTPSAQAGSAAAWEYYERYGQKEWAGIKPLMFSLHEPGYIHMRSKQIRTLSDFKGMKIRAPSRQTNRLLASLGATPVSMPLPAVAEAVSKGVIDGFLLPWDVIPSLRLDEMAKLHTETPLDRPALYTAMNVIAMNPDTYKRMPADLKAVIDRNSGAGLATAAGRTWDAVRAPMRKPAVDRGNAFYQVPNAEIDNWIKASAPLYGEWTADMEKAGHPGRQMLKDAQELIAKYQRVVAGTASADAGR